MLSPDNGGVTDDSVKSTGTRRPHAPDRRGRGDHRPPVLVGGRMSWAWVKGYHGLYRISTRGQIRRVGRWQTLCDGRVRYLKPQTMTWTSHSTGYWVVTLTKNKKESLQLLHRLVARAFLSNPDRKPQVNHIDGNKKNPRVNNLEWVTQLENEKHAKTTGLKASGARCRNFKIPVADYKKIRKRVLKGVSKKIIARQYGVGEGTIYAICNRSTPCYSR